MPIEAVIGEAIGAMIITFPIALMIMAAIAAPRLKQVWLRALVLTFGITFIAALVDYMFVGWGVVAVVAFILRNPAKDNFMTKHD